MIKVRSILSTPLLLQEQLVLLTRSNWFLLVDSTKNYPLSPILLPSVKSRRLLSMMAAQNTHLAFITTFLLLETAKVVKLPSQLLQMRKLGLEQSVLSKLPTQVRVIPLQALILTLFLVFLVPHCLDLVDLSALSFLAKVAVHLSS